MANQTSATFLRVVGSELIQKYLGDGPRLVRELFRVADDLSPTIVFIGAPASGFPCGFGISCMPSGVLGDIVKSLGLCLVMRPGNFLRLFKGPLCDCSGLPTTLARPSSSLVPRFSCQLRCSFGFLASYYRDMKVVAVAKVCHSCQSSQVELRPPWRAAGCYDPHFSDLRSPPSSLVRRLAVA